jgi:deazaflavin-dependent oxidoreductase (nitroreductase family)
VQRLTALFTHYTARSRRLAALWGRIHSAAVVRTGGRVGGKWFGAPVLVLVTVGRKSGKTRETPLLYRRDEDDGTLALLAANAGNDRTPAWWLNLRAAETAEIIVRGARRRVRWREATGEEHARLFAALVEVYPPAGHYPGFTDRHLPVVVLTDV